MGCSLPELAVAFPVAHPAVTSVIIGPRTMDQLNSLVKGVGLVLDAALDRIDEIVPPGTNLYQPDCVWRSPALADAAQRRRAPGDRAAGTPWAPCGAVFHVKQGWTARCGLMETRSPGRRSPGW